MIMNEGECMKKYDKIADDLKRRINSGEFKENNKLPTGNELMLEYNASKNTITSAINLLINDGILFAIHGSGFYIRKPNKGTIKLNNTSGFYVDHPGQKLERTILDFQLINCDEELAKLMECEENTPIYYIKRLMYIDDIPFAVEYTYYNKNIIPYLSEDIAKKSIFSFITDDLKLNIGFSEKYISTKPLSQEDLVLLQLEPGAFGLIIDDNVFLSNGKKFNYSKIWYNYKYANFFNNDKSIRNKK